jgi:hypothetical protein
VQFRLLLGRGPSHASLKRIPNVIAHSYNIQLKTMNIPTTAANMWKQRDVVPSSRWRAIKAAVLRLWEQPDVVPPPDRRAIKIKVLRACKRSAEVAASSQLVVPICMILSVGAVYWFYCTENYLNGGEPFALFDGISAWPSIAIIIFAGLLSIHFILKAHFDLRKNADKLAKKFGLSAPKLKQTPFFGWEITPLKPGIPRPTLVFPGLDFNTQEANRYQGFVEDLRLPRPILEAALACHSDVFDLYYGPLCHLASDWRSSHSPHQGPV